MLADRGAQKDKVGLLTNYSVIEAIRAKCSGGIIDTPV